MVVRQQDSQAWEKYIGDGEIVARKRRGKGK